MPCPLGINYLSFRANLPTDTVVPAATSANRNAASPATAFTPANRNAASPAAAFTPANRNAPSSVTAFVPANQNAGPREDIAPAAPANDFRKLAKTQNEKLQLNSVSEPKRAARKIDFAVETILLAKLLRTFLLGKA